MWNLCETESSGSMTIAILGHSYANLFIYYLQLLSQYNGRVDDESETIYYLKSIKYLLSGLYQKGFVYPNLTF
jgi:hypothetical protein